MNILNKQPLKTASKTASIKSSQLIIALIIGVFVSSKAFAAPEVSLEVLAEKEVVEINEKGKTLTKRVIAVDTVPGDKLFYTINYKNSGDEAATNVVVNNPVAEGTTYQSDSAWGANSEILFSLSGDQDSFKKSGELSSQVKNESGKVETQQVPQEQYRAIRWIIEDIPKNSSGKVGFSVVVN